MWQTFQGTKKAYRFLVALAERGRPPGRLSHSWKDNITMDRTGIGWDGVNWIHLS
jgi:hypothetical protein